MVQFPAFFLFPVMLAATGIALAVLLVVVMTTRKLD
jgi:hypothetical protein